LNSDENKPKILALTLSVVGTVPTGLGNVVAFFVWDKQLAVGIAAPF
jgi:hypothetical protein